MAPWSSEASNTSYTPSPPENAYVISQESDNGNVKKIILLGVLGGIVIFALVAIGGGVYIVGQTTTNYSKAAEKNAKEISALLDDSVPTSSSFTAISQVQAEEYENPFEETTNYTNPFDEVINPFDEIPEN